MQFFKQLTDPALKRLYKFVLKRLIGRFLAEDEIDLDQLDVHLRSGRLELCDLLLSADVLNAEICEAHGLPFRVKRGYLGSVRVTISYMNIMSESCLVEIDDIEIVLVPVGEEDEPKANTNARGTATKPSVSDSNVRGAANETTGELRERGNSNEYTDEVSQEGLDFVASWIEQVTSKIKVTLSNICLRLETSDAASGKHVALLCKLEWAQFTDESASEVASVYGRGGMDQSLGASSQSMYQSMAASSLFGISQKAVKFRGISMDLLLPSDELEEDDSSSVLHHFMASDSTRQCYVQLKLSHYEALEAPSVDADLFIHSVRVVLQPQHFSYFGTLLDAFSDERPVKRTKERLPVSSVSMYASICESNPAWLAREEEGESSEGGVQLSLREFQRIEQLLLQYHKTHEELVSAQRSRGHDNSASYEHADFPYPVPRRLSSAESVESVGLSDLEDDESFFECDPGAESMTASAHFGRSSNVMAQSMYASALYEPLEEKSAASDTNVSGSLRTSIRHRSSRTVRTRVKVHLLECDVVVLYDDMLDHEEDEDDERDYSSESRRQKQLRRRRRGLPIITDQERIEVVIKDVILSTLVYPSYTTLAVSVGTFEILEKMQARMSTDIDGDEDALLTTSVLRFADVSPATSRKVHLSANLSAQIRIEANAVGGIDSLAVQISAQPIILEWDMHIIDRAHRLMKLMEESSAAKQRKKATEVPDKDGTVYPKTLDLNTECVEITLRFPMVNSDLIRFGPSSKKGLSEDKLVLMLEGVKASAHADGAESESPVSTTTKPKLPWLSEFDVRFDTVSATLVGPADGDQRNTVLRKSPIVRGRSDVTSGDSCRLRVRMQVPTNDEIRSALTAKHNISQDSLEQYIESTTNMASDAEEKSGDDNDGGRVGSNGWSQDARNRAHEFEVAASAAALIDLEIQIPHSNILFNKQSFDRLMILFDALMMINPIDVNGHNQMMVTAAYRSRLVPSYMTVNVELNDGTLQLEYAQLACDVDENPSVSFIYHFAFQDFRVFQVSQWMGQLVSRVHVAAQNITLLEEDAKSKVTVPVLYKNPIGVNEAPVLFVGIDIVDQTQEMREMKVELHVSQVNMRYDVSSKCMIYLSELLLLEYPPPIIPLDSASTTPDEYAEILLQVKTSTYETVKLAVPPKTVFTKLFVSFYDAIVDYSPTTLSSRIMVVLGNVSVSSNVVTGALIQGYKISVRDIQLHLTPNRPTYEEIDDSILGNELLTSSKNSKRVVVRFPGESRSRGQLSALYPSQLMFFEKHGFLQMVTVDFIDVFLRAIVPPVEQTSPVFSSERKVSPSSLGAPELSVELNLGTANIYACFDSFNTLIEVITTWTEQLSVEGEPRDTTAYVGLDRVKDLASVSVVTNLGPATVRSSRPSVDESLSQTPPLTSARLAAQNARSNGLDYSQTSHISRTHSMTSRTASSGVNLFAQLDENAFGNSRRVFSGSHATTDTEARLLQTRLDEIQKEKDRMVSGMPFARESDDTMSAAELRRKYAKEEEEPMKPKMRINELVIEDYYSGNGVNSGGDMFAGDFLMSSNAEPTQVHASDDQDPWLSSRNISQAGIQDGSHPVGSLPDEHSARWLGPGVFGDSIAASSHSSSPRFDPVDGDALFEMKSPASDDALLELKLPASGLANATPASYDDNEDDEFPSAGFPAGPKNWWGMEAPHDVELSELQTEETESHFSHRPQFVDDEESSEGGDNGSPHPLSMSMMIGKGEDEGTEVELDFTLDREMQSKFNHLMDIDSTDGKDVEDLDEEEDDDEKSDTRYEHHQQTPLSLGGRRTSKLDLTPPVSIPLQRLTSFSDQSTHSGAASAIPSLFSPPDEPTARWFYDDLAGDSSQREGPPSRIYPHHVEIPIGGTAASLSFGEREFDEAIRGVAREGIATKNPVTSPIVIRHVLLRDFNICMRFFGGSDWSKDLVNVPTLNRHGAASAAGTQDTRVVETTATKDHKEKLLDTLLDNYVPSPDRGLFGSEPAGSSLFSPPLSRIGNRVDSERSAATTSATSRKRSLKSGRKTEEMLELVVTRIQMRLDVFNEEESQPLASNTVLAFGDIEILDYISTSQIRKIICYWKSDASHPRESGSSMVHVHLMTVRPGPNLCEEHRLKVRMLPLRVNLDQEVVSFLRQFVPPDAGGRGAATSRAGVEEDDDDGGNADMEGTELSAMSLQPQSNVTETDVSLGVWFFQSIDIRPCKIKIDYRPNRVDFDALRAGDYLEVINLFVLEGMELVLRRVKASGIDGWAALGEHVLMSWVNDISRHQIHKCVASVSMPPLRPFANIGSGAADLILLPLEHYGRDRRLVRGIKKGAKSFLKSVTIETLNTASKVAQGTQALLEHADDVVSSASSRKKQIKYRQPGSRIARNSKSMGGGGIRSAQDRGGIGSRQYLAQQPSNATEGLYQAYDSLSRELHVAAKTIVAVPLIEYKKTGSQGYVRSVIRAVPVAVLRPMIGASEAVSKALIGVRNAMDPEMKEDVENKFKDFRTI